MSSAGAWYSMEMADGKVEKFQHASGNKDD